MILRVATFVRSVLMIFALPHARQVNVVVSCIMRLVYQIHFTTYLLTTTLRLNDNHKVQEEHKYLIYIECIFDWKRFTKYKVWGYGNL